MGDNAAVSTDEFGFLRTADGARILCNPNSEYYAGETLPKRNYFLQPKVPERRPFRPSYRDDEMRNLD